MGDLVCSTRHQLGNRGQPPRAPVIARPWPLLTEIRGKPVPVNSRVPVDVTRLTVEVCVASINIVA